MDLKDSSEACELRLTVLFEGPFWIGLLERIEAGRYTVCKITFGPEPKDAEVYDFLLANWPSLRFSPSLPAERRKCMAQAKLTGKKCYDHLGGRLGAVLFLYYIEKEWIELEEGSSTAYRLTEKGRAAFAQMGLDLGPMEP